MNYELFCIMHYELCIMNYALNLLFCELKFSDERVVVGSIDLADFET